MDELEYLGASQLRLTLPGGLSGSTSVLVRRADTSQAMVLEGAFSYPVAKSGGGGCAGVVAGLPRTPGRALGQGAWILGLMLLVGLRARWRSALVPARQRHDG